MNAEAMNIEAVIIAVVAIAVGAGYFFLRKKRDTWQDKIEDFILNAKVPSTLPAGAVFLVPGGGMDKYGDMIAQVAANYPPKLIIVSGRDADDDAGAVRNGLNRVGMDKGLVFWEKYATSTPENGKFSAAVNPFPRGPFVIFKQRFHLPRCLECYSRFGFRGAALYPVDEPGAKLARAEDEAKKIVEDIFEIETGKVADYPMPTLTEE